MKNRLSNNKTFTPFAHGARGETLLSQFILYPLRATSPTRGTLAAMHVKYMIKISKLLFLLLLICFNMSSCDFIDNKLTICNRTNESIVFIIPAEPDYFPTNFDEDTVITKRINDSLLNTRAKYESHREGFGGVHFLYKGATKNVLAFNIYWEDIIENTPDKQLVIYFYPDSVLTSGKYLWRDILDKKMYNKQMIFTLEDLEEAKWTVYYRN